MLEIRYDTFEEYKIATELQKGLTEKNHYITIRERNKTTLMDKIMAFSMLMLSLVCLFGLPILIYFVITVK